MGDAAQIRASYVRQQKTDRRDAAHILKLLVEGRFPRIWMPSSEVRDLRQLLLHRYKLVIIRARVKNELQHLCLNKGVQRKHKLWSKVGQQMLRELPLKPWAARRREDLLRLLAMLDQQIAPLDQAVKAEAQRDKMALLLETQPGVGPITALAYVLTMGDVRRFAARQAGGQLPGPDSARALFGRTAEAGCDHQARQSHAAHVAGGSGAERSASGSWISQRVLSIAVTRKPKAVAKVAAARKLAVRLYWMLRTQTAVSGGRSYREQPAGAPGRRKLDRELIGRSRIP